MQQRQGERQQWKWKWNGLYHSNVKYTMMYYGEVPEVYHGLVKYGNVKYGIVKYSVV